MITTSRGPLTGWRNLRQEPDCRNRLIGFRTLVENKDKQMCRRTEIRHIPSTAIEPKRLQMLQESRKVEVKE